MTIRIGSEIGQASRRIVLVTGAVLLLGEAAHVVVPVHSKVPVKSPPAAARLRRAEIGTHHHIAGPYLSAYAAEMGWREDHRRVSNGEQYLAVTAAALAHPVSRQWAGYWQRTT